MRLAERTRNFRIALLLTIPDPFAISRAQRTSPADPRVVLGSPRRCGAAHLATHEAFQLVPLFFRQTDHAVFNGSMRIYWKVGAIWFNSTLFNGAMYLG